MANLVLGILERFLGQSHRHNSDTGQVQFDCPACAEAKGISKGDGKGNLEVNYMKGVFKCWSCYETNNMSGMIPRLVTRFGSKQDLRDYKLISPDYIFEEKDHVPTETSLIIDLPEGFIPLTGCNPMAYRYQEAMDYLRKRNITDEIIKKYNIGYTTVGKYANRVIIPSYDIDGNVTFFVGRAFLKWVKPKYLNPDEGKNLIIFNEKLVNWDSTIYLVEGAFDEIVVPNSIPLLGKYISDKLFHDLQYKAQGLVVIVLDGDAYKDAVRLYKHLNTLNLYNRVRIVKLNYDWDISKVNEKLNKKGVFNVLKSAYKIPESRL